MVFVSEKSIVSNDGGCSLSELWPDLCVGGPRCSVVHSVAFKQIQRIRGKDENKDGATADPAYGLCRAAAASSLSSLPG